MSWGGFSRRTAVWLLPLPPVLLVGLCLLPLVFAGLPSMRMIREPPLLPLTLSFQGPAQIHEKALAAAGAMAHSPRAG